MSQCEEEADDCQEEEEECEESLGGTGKAATSIIYLNIKRANDSQLHGIPRSPQKAWVKKHSLSFPQAPTLLLDGRER